MDAPARTLIALCVIAQPAGIRVTAAGLVAQAPPGTWARAQAWCGYETSGTVFVDECETPSAQVMPDRIRLGGDGQLLFRDGCVFAWEAQGSFAVVTWGGGPDFDCDGDAGTDADIEAFFACLAAPCASADYDGDGSPATDGDIQCFFAVLRGGWC